MELFYEGNQLKGYLNSDLEYDLQMMHGIPIVDPFDNPCCEACTKLNKEPRICMNALPISQQTDNLVTQGKEFVCDNPKMKVYLKLKEI